MSKNDRFEKVYSQGAVNIMEIWVDKIATASSFSDDKSFIFSHLPVKKRIQNQIS